MHFIEAIQGVVKEEAGAVVEKVMSSLMEAVQGTMGEEDVVVVEKASWGTSLTTS